MKKSVPSNLPLDQITFSAAGFLLRAFLRFSLVFWLAFAVGSGILRLEAQEEGAYEKMASNKPAPESFDFLMKLKNDADVTVQIQPISKKSQKNRGDKSVSGTPRTIQREVRNPVVRVTENSPEGSTVRYYAGNWCAGEDPRRGVTLVQTSFDGVALPLASYHFPELIWATPQTRKPSPELASSGKKVIVYVAGDSTLEVDAVFGRPLRFVDGVQEWKYSYKDTPAPIVIPEKIREALSKILPNQ